MNLFRSPFFLPWLYPQLLWRMKTTSKELYLTFDDGPVSGPTDFVLDELKKVDAKGTFFCIGDNIKKHPQVFKKIVEQGHGVGNHTFHHLSGWKTKKEKYLENIRLCEDELTRQHQDFLGQSQRPKANGQHLFRPPYGRIKRSQIRLLTEYQIVMWDVLTHDYAKNLAPDTCLNGSIAATRPGSIIVFHDSLKAEKNLTYVLPRFINHFKNLGYTFHSLA